MPAEVTVTTERVAEVNADALMVGATTNGGAFELGQAARTVDEALDGRLSQYLSGLDYKAKHGETVVVPTFGGITAPTVAVVGLGRDPGPTEVRRAGGSAVRKLRQHRTIASTLHEGTDIAASVEGLLLGSYRFTGYKSDGRSPKPERIVVIDADPGAVDEGRARAGATLTARDLMNEPASTLSPEEFAARAKALAEGAGIGCEVLDENDLAERGFGGLLAVAQGSHRPPRLIVLHYQPTDAKEKVALVGKGVTFDSGGLSIKDAKSMETMKTDMGGGAAVIGAMSALPTIGSTSEVIAIVPMTENMPGGGAIRPGDVIRHYGGRTGEVLNTDAEGRLILADALAYACEQQPAAIVDAATLTGAMMVALGRKAAGYFATDDDLAAEIEAAGRATGERLWRMPLYDDYRSDMDSDVADIKNTGARWGGAIFGALYLRDFVRKDIPWAHLDIAGPSRVESDFDEVTKGGSGFGARTLLAWLERRGS